MVLSTDVRSPALSARRDNAAGDLTTVVKWRRAEAAEFTGALAGDATVGQLRDATRTGGPR